MKKVLLIATIAIFMGSYDASAQEIASKSKTEIKTAKKTKKAKEGAATALPKVQGAGMVFENETIDYGTIEHAADGKREFVLTNNGTEPLTITNAVGSCGCTVPSFPKEPILPGAKAVIGVKYDTNRAGAFTKSVTITSNAVGSPSKVLTIKGTVNAAPAVATPASPLTPTVTPTPAVSKS